MTREGFLPGSDPVERMRRSLERYGKKKSVKAILIKINSPGGTVASSQELYRLIAEARARYQKPVIAFLGDVAASGGYYAACAADAIVADPGTLTGSIGVIFQTGQFDGLLKRFGVQFRTIKSGKFKDIGSSTRPMLPEEERILQEMISQAYEQFLEAVAKGRRMPSESVRPLADGRVYIGEQALRLGLVDSIGGFSEALERAKKLGGIEGEAKLLEEWDLKEEIFSELLKGATFLQGRLSPPSGLLYLWSGY